MLSVNTRLHVCDVFFYDAQILQNCYQILDSHKKDGWITQVSCRHNDNIASKIIISSVFSSISYTELAMVLFCKTKRTSCRNIPVRKIGTRSGGSGQVMLTCRTRRYVSMVTLGLHTTHARWRHGVIKLHHLHLVTKQTYQNWKLLLIFFLNIFITFYNHIRMYPYSNLKQKRLHCLQLKAIK